MGLAVSLTSSVIGLGVYSSGRTQQSGQCLGRVQQVLVYTPLHDEQENNTAYRLAYHCVHKSSYEACCLQVENQTRAITNYCCVV